MRKLTSEKLAEIARLRALEWPRDDIAKAVNLSAGTVSAAYKQLDARKAEPPVDRAAEPPAPAVPPAIDESTEAPGLESQLAWLGTIVRQRRADADRCRAAGDNVGAARATRDALAAAQLLARHTAKPDSEGVTVSAEAIKAAGERARALLARLVDRALARKLRETGS